jgi:hypothetical protein
MYERLKIAHTDQVKSLEEEIDLLKGKLTSVEQRLSDLNTSKN